MKKVGVILSGCGVADGSEIHEAVLTLLALDRQNVEIHGFAPDGDQNRVMNHLTGTEVVETRNMLVEAARILRGDIRNIHEFNADGFDAVVFPGGFGVAKSLSTFAKDGATCSVHPEIRRVISDMHSRNKALGAICIAPILIARVLGKGGFPVTVTVGNDADIATAIKNMGAKHAVCDATSFVLDRDHKVVTTPAYMLCSRISHVELGISRTMDALMELV